MGTLGKMLDGLLGRREPARPAGDAGAPREFFTQVYQHNIWAGEASRSGRGSEGEFAAQKVALFKEVIAARGIASLLDLGCGDFHWMREIAPTLERYHGVDVVREMIEANQSRFASAQVSFQCLDLSDRGDQSRLQLKKADLVSCLDVIGHMLNAEVDSLLRFIVRYLDARYLLVANRRDEQSAEFLVREKTRYEGIDIEQHPLFQQRAPRRVMQIAALYPGDFYDLYEMKRA